MAVHNHVTLYGIVSLFAAVLYIHKKSIFTRVSTKYNQRTNLQHCINASKPTGLNKGKKYLLALQKKNIKVYNLFYIALLDKEYLANTLHRKAYLLDLNHLRKFKIVWKISIF